MTQQNSDENKNVEHDLKDILDALNENEQIVDIPQDYQSDDVQTDGDTDVVDFSEDSDAPDAHAVLEKLMAENASLKDDVMRGAADMQNLRKRTQREVADAKIFSVSAFAKDMLSVADNLKRTLDAAKANGDEEGSQDQQLDDSLKALLEGVEMTERSMLSAMERHGVKKLDVMNKKFDPNFHQAMFEVPNEDVPNNSVVQVVQDGYVIGERVLRPAMVGVAKGGPKFVDADTSDPGDQAS